MEKDKKVGRIDEEREITLRLISFEFHQITIWSSSSASSLLSLSASLESEKLGFGFLISFLLVRRELRFRKRCAGRWFCSAAGSIFPLYSGSFFFSSHWTPLPAGLIKKRCFSSRLPLSPTLPGFSISGLNPAVLTTASGLASPATKDPE